MVKRYSFSYFNCKVPGWEDRFKFLMDTPNEAIINCVAKYVFLLTLLKENQTV